jgi:general stress protein 26
MAQQTIATLADKMQQIDFAMLSTHSEDGQIGARPMSNNQDVAYGGDSYYFTTEDTLMVKDI